MSDKSTCPGCSTVIPMSAVAFELQLACPSCRTDLQVPLIYQVNLTIGSFVLALATTYLLDVERHFVSVLFMLSFAFAVFLATVVVPLLPPKLQARE